MDIICVYGNDDLSAPIQYTFELLLSAFDVRYRVMPLRQLTQEGDHPRQALFISYGRAFLDLGAEKQIHIYASGFFGENYLKPEALPQRPLKRYDGLPVIYYGHGSYDWIRYSTGLIETNIDIIASSFFMVSRYEEAVLDVKDEHERFPASASLALQEGFLDRPIVNEYIELLWEWIRALRPDLKRRPLWPQDKDFAVCLTHDVDSLRKYSVVPPIRAMGGAVLRQRDPRMGLAMAADYLGTLLRLKKDPFDTFDYILDLEHRYAFKSSFYFMAGGDSEFDKRYSLTDRSVVKLIRKIEDKGCEVGLHPSYNSYNNLDYMVLEKARLDRVVGNSNYGCRQHYLRWKTPDTWRIQESTGLPYDTSLSFADHVGFRCGFCLPARPFDIVGDRELNIWELPLVVHESGMAGYQNLRPGEAYQEALGLIEAAKQCQGVFVLIWHNSSFDTSGRWAGWKEVYERLMRYIGEQNAWVTSGREVIQWWEQGPPLIARGTGP